MHIATSTQVSTIKSYRPKLDALVDRLVGDRRQRAEALQVAALGILVALSRHGRGPRFRRAAMQTARAELRRWRAS